MVRWPCYAGNICAPQGVGFEYSAFRFREQPTGRSIVTKFRLMLASVLAIFMLAAPLAVASPSSASTSSYSRVRHIVQGPNAWIVVVCKNKTTGGVKNLAWGDDSFSYCPAYGGYTSGWVESVSVYGGNTCFRVKAENRANGVQYLYPWGGGGSIPGGDYNAWIINRC